MRAQGIVCAAGALQRVREASLPPVQPSPAPAAAAEAAVQGTPRTPGPFKMKIKSKLATPSPLQKCALHTLSG